MAEAVSEFVRGKIIGRFQKIGPDKHQRGVKYEYLKRKSMHFIYVKEAVETERIKQLQRGDVPRRECKIWLQKAEEITPQVKGILNSEGKSSDFEALSQTNVLTKTLLDEIAALLEKFVELDLLIDAQHGKMKRRSPKTQGEIYGSQTKTETTHLPRKAVTESKLAKQSEMQSARANEVSRRKEMQNLKDIETSFTPLFDASVHKPEVVKKHEIEAAKIELLAVPKSEAEPVSVIEAASEIISAPAHKALLVPDLEGASRSKAAGRHGIISLPVTVTLPMHEPGIEFTPVPKGLSKKTLTVETSPDSGVGMFSHHASDIVPLPSESGEENLMGPEISEKYEVASEIISAPAQEALLVPDLVGASSIKAAGGHAIIPPPVTDISPMHEPGFEFTPAVPEGLFRTTETFESNLGAGRAMISHYPSEIVPSPSKIEEKEKDQMRPESRISLKKSVNPEANQEISLFPGKEDEDSTKNEVKVERHFSNARGLSPRAEKKFTRSVSHTAEKILECIRNGTARRIGIYGNGGIGKTTVLKVLFNYPHKKDMFDSIIWVTLSRYSNRRTIQKQIAKQLLTCPADSDIDSETISCALKSKKILLLLDNVWEEIDLSALGIPNPGQENGCTIILTTRSIDVCHYMAAITSFEMQVLSSDESWEFFHDQVGEIIDSPEIKPYARAIVVECGGLPLTAVVTGRALRRENDLWAWKHALKAILPSTRWKHHSEAVIQQLKFSYDKLKDRDVKDCFLYCALLQEDRDVNVLELISYFTNEGLIAGNSADACEKGNNIVKTLLEASLLESTDGGLSVKMHDVIRDLALAIMSPEAEGCHFMVRPDLRLSEKLESPQRRDEILFPKGHQFLTCAGAGLTKPPPNGKWEHATRIFLMDNELLSLPENPSCPKVLTLFLQRNNRLRVIPMSFFDGMPHLQVLNLSKTRIRSLPQSIFKLNRLKVLLLRDCERFSTLPGDIGHLEHLELLDLSGTEIYNLPDEIAKLSHLKHMLVSFYGSSNSSEYMRLPAKLVSDGIISKLHHLNELSIAIYPGDQRWGRSVKSLTVEVHNLTELQILDFCFPEVELLELFIRESPSWKSKGLTKFKFVVGQNVRRAVARVPGDVESEYNQQDRCLRFVNGETISSPLVEVLSRTTAFYLDNHLNVHNLSEFAISNINALEFCILRECREIQTVVDCKEVDRFVLPLLRNLSIHYLWNLKTIWKGPMPTGSLSRLRILSIHTCPKLPSVLTCSMLQNLYSLEVLAVEDCEAVKGVVINDTDSCGDIVLPNLKSLKLHYLPNLVSIWSGSWPSIEHISFYDCPQLKSLHMTSKSICNIKEIKAEKKWWDELKWEETELFLRLQANFTEICYEDL